MPGKGELDMGTIRGFVLGYYLGVKASPEGVSIARDLIAEGGAAVARRLAEYDVPLRRAA